MNDDDHGGPADEPSHGDGHGHHDSYHEASGEPRTTAPQQDYTGGQVRTGLVVLLVGLVVVFGVPLLL